MHHEVIVAGWAGNESDADRIAKGAGRAPISAEGNDAIGFSLSLEWKTDRDPKWIRHPGVQLRAAIKYFEVAAANGFWRSAQQLRVHEYAWYRNARKPYQGICALQQGRQVEQTQGTA
jgi:hypothetical protein